MRREKREERREQREERREKREARREKGEERIVISQQSHCLCYTSFATSIVSCLVLGSFCIICVAEENDSIATVVGLLRAALLRVIMPRVLVTTVVKVFK